MNKPTLLLDMDGVMVDHNWEILQEINELFGSKAEVPK